MAALFIRKAVGYLIDLRSRDGAVFGKAAVHGRANSRHGGTEMTDAAAAEFACAAKLVRINADLIAAHKPCNMFAALHHFTGKFMP